MSTNAEIRDFIEIVNGVEQRVAAAVRAHGDERWAWAPYAKPLSPPVIWNDLRVTKADGKVRTVEALTYIEETES